MPQLVQANQCSFVPDRQALDNIIIAQEVLHTMRRKKEKGDALLLKLILKRHMIE